MAVQFVLVRTSIGIEDPLTSEIARVNDDGQLLVTDLGIVSAVIDKTTIGTQNITTGTTETILSVGVATSKVIKILGMVVGGNESGYFQLKIAGVTKLYGRTSGSKRTLQLSIPNNTNILATEAQVITIDCENVGRGTKEFEATLFAIEIDA